MIKKMRSLIGGRLFSNKMDEKILQVMENLEKENKIKIIFSVESGSKSIGLDSKDSDYDVRCFYINELDWYLTITENKIDEIHYKHEELDISCIDLRKALKLLKNYNIPFLEWFTIPLIYKEDKVMKELKDFAEKQFSRCCIIINYASIAKTNWDDFIRDKEEVNRKKYIYILRHLLAGNYLLLYPDYKKMPPLNVSFCKLKSSLKF